MVARGLHSDFSLGASDADETDVRLWHLTDVDADAQHVRFQRKADILNPLTNVRL